MTEPNTQHQATSEPAPPPVRFNGLTIDIPGGTDVTAFANGGIALAVGSPIVPDVRIHLGHPDHAVAFLAAALDAVVALCPETAPGPDPRLIEARGIVAEDILRLAGTPLHAGARPLEEFTTSDLRTIRRLAAHQLGLLDELIEAAEAPRRSLRAVR